MGPRIGLTAKPHGHVLPSGIRTSAVSRAAADVRRISAILELLTTCPQLFFRRGQKFFSGSELTA